MGARAVTKYTVVECDVRRTTEKALLIYFYDDNNELSAIEKWIPRSVVEDGDSVEVEDEATLHIATWFCEKEGIPTS